MLRRCNSDSVTIDMRLFRHLVPARLLPADVLEDTTSSDDSSGSEGSSGGGSEGSSEEGSEEGSEEEEKEVVKVRGGAGGACACTRPLQRTAYEPGP